MTKMLSANDFSILSVIARQKGFNQNYNDKYAKYYNNLSHFGADVARNILGHNPPPTNEDAAKAALVIENYVKR